MKLQILGMGCAKCKQLEANARQAAAEISPDCVVEKISDLGRIAEMGVMVTPALAVDGKVVSAGKLLSAEQILDIVKGGN
jgi:small redox-active disulfide protein 2